MLEDLLKPAKKSQLLTLLSHHVCASSNALADSLKVGKVNLLQGDSSPVDCENGKIRVNEAAVLNPEVTCQDGVIHVIDAVGWTALGGAPPDRPQWWVHSVRVADCEGHLSVHGSPLRGLYR